MQVFGSLTLNQSLRDQLLTGLEDVHAVRPLLPDDPRDTVLRVTPLLQDMGLQTTRIRGVVCLGGVEVDHVWLAVGTSSWVLDASFPLHSGAFVSLLPGYVAGTTSRQELSCAAAQTSVRDRVVANLPSRVQYRGSPYWGAED